MNWNNVMKEIRDTNKVLLFRQDNKTYIPVTDKSTEFVLKDFCIDGSGKFEDMEWQCQHINISIESVLVPCGRFEPIEELATVCDDCEAIFNDVAEEWEHEK